MESDYWVRLVGGRTEVESSEHMQQLVSTGGCKIVLSGQCDYFVLALSTEKWVSSELLGKGIVGNVLSTV